MWKNKKIAGVHKTYDELINFRVRQAKIKNLIIFTPIDLEKLRETRTLVIKKIQRGI